MSAAKHTPGPWHWRGNTLEPVEQDYRKQAVSSILDDDGEGRGYLGRSLKDTMEELDADRRLIAAAPDLLAALERAITYLPADCAATYICREAIAKATGSSL